MSLKNKTASVCGILMLMTPAAALAGNLTSLWTLEPSAKDAPTTVTYGQRFYEQRLTPFRAVRIVNGSVPAVAAGSLLYLVFDAQQNVAYCTFKDMSAKNQAAHLFMPILDRRPCFIDADRDGKFEATFSVFDKYGSMATPSGNLGDARPLSAPVAYEQADPHSVQQGMRIAFTLSGSKDPERATITVAFDKAGRERWEPLIGKIPRSGNIQTVVNSEVTIHSVSGRDATISVVADPNLLVTGGSGGTLVTTYRPKFLP